MSFQWLKLLRTLYIIYYNLYMAIEQLYSLSAGINGHDMEIYTNN